MKWKPIVTALLALAVSVSAANAQTCTPIAAALEALAANCASMARGQLCQDGQVVSVDGLGSFTVGAAALARIQASYPDVDPDQFASVAFVGALQVNPVIVPSLTSLPPRVPVEVTLTSGKANVRPQPARVGEAIAQFVDGIQLNATGITRGAAWIRVQLPDQPEQPAWMSRTVLHSEYDLALLPVVTAEDPIPQYPQFTPLQAFAFTPASPCAGVILQSGEELVRFQVDGVDLELHDATAFLQNTGAGLDIYVLEGLLQVQALETTTVGVAGSLIRVALKAPGQPDAAPQLPQPYDASLLAWLAGDYAQRPVTAAPAAVAATIDDALVTPLSGVWQIEYPPPYSYPSEEGPQCEPFTVKGGTHLFDLYVATDGSSFSTYNPDMTIGAGLRVLPGRYELKDFAFVVLSPTQMTATYDTNPLAACTSIITITAQWLNSGQ